MAYNMAPYETHASQGPVFHLGGKINETPVQKSLRICSHSQVED